jgi:hypothetical protein
MGGNTPGVAGVVAVVVVVALAVVEAVVEAVGVAVPLTTGAFTLVDTMASPLAQTDYVASDDYEFGQRTSGDDAILRTSLAARARTSFEGIHIGLVSLAALAAGRLQKRRGHQTAGT